MPQIPTPIITNDALYQLSYTGFLASIRGAGYLLPIKWGFGRLSLAMRLGLMANLGAFLLGRKNMKNTENMRMQKTPWRPRKFSCEEELAEQFVSYAQYVEDNPILELKLFFCQGEVISAQLRKPRPMTVESFCTFLSVSSRTWRHWKASRDDLAEMIDMIEDAIYDQLFCLAAVNLIKPSLINRKLGLAHTDRVKNRSRIQSRPHK